MTGRTRHQASLQWRGLRWLGLVPVLVLALTRPLLADNDDDGSVDKTRQALDALDAEVVRLRGHIKNLSGSKERLSDEIQSLELERAMLSAEIRKHNLEIDVVSKQIADLDDRQQQLQADIEKARDQIAMRLRRIYKTGHLGYAHMLLGQSQLSDMITAFHYAKMMTRRDHAQFVDYRQLLDSQAELLAELEQRRSRQSELAAELREREFALSDTLRRRNAALNEIKRTQSQKKELMNDLLLDREELTMAIKRMQDDAGDPEAFRVPISRYRGRLNWPVRGPIKRGFGVFTDPEFNTKRVLKGVDLAVPKGTPVKAVFSGKVIFADWFKSYGNLIIIDHGEKVLSFYAHNDQLLARKGDFVERDALIAYSGDSGSLEGDFLHFEIREAGKPVNPTSWMDSKP